LITFPHPLTADSEGVVAFGGYLHPDILELAYTYGIFPWFNPGEVPLWWFPNPRMILLPHEVKVSKSMRSIFNQKKFDFTLDQRFEEVMRNCKNVERDGSASTWIGEGLIQSFRDLHKKGMAHSLEVWEAGKLVGGLYGVSRGRIFYGESMFTLRPNASKFALIALCRILHEKGFWLIDCQEETDHLRSMGAKTIKAKGFFKKIRTNLRFLDEHQHNWSEWAEQERDRVYQLR